MEAPFQTAATVVLSGNGSVINRGTIAATGQALLDGFSSTGGAVAFTNNGTITGTATNGSYGIQLGSSAFTNNGTVNIIGNGVSTSYNNRMLNTGSITATGTAVSAFGIGIDNRGTITSTGGSASP